MCKVRDLPDSACNIVFTTSLDACKTIDFVAQSVLAMICDEMHFSDVAQIQFFSEEMAKILFDRTKPCVIRSKGCQELVLPAGMALLLTANGFNVNEWLAPRATFSKPIQWKLITVCVDKPLLPRRNESEDPDVSQIAANYEASELSKMSKAFFENM